MRHSFLVCNLQASPDNTRAIDVMSLKHVAFWGCAASTAYKRGSPRLSEPLQALGFKPGQGSAAVELPGALPTQIAVHCLGRTCRILPLRNVALAVHFSQAHPPRTACDSLVLAHSYLPLGQKWIVLVLQLMEFVFQLLAGCQALEVAMGFPKWERADGDLELSPEIRFGVTELMMESPLPHSEWDSTLDHRSYFSSADGSSNFTSLLRMLVINIIAMVHSVSSIRLPWP